MNIRIVLFITSLMYSVVGLAQISFQNQEEDLISGDAIYGIVTSNGLGSGISFFDFDNDGWDDITIPASANSDFQFFKNTGGSFEEITLPINSEGIQSRQAIWVDFDNDGDNDFFGTSDIGQLSFFRNDGNDTFSNISGTSGLPPQLWQFWGASWGDYDSDGFLDVFLSVRDNAQIEHNLLYHNNGEGFFTDVTEQAGLDQTGFITFCSAFFDYDNDGDQDIYMANDKCVTSNILYRNNGDGTFTDVSQQAGVNLFMSAMSTTIDDYDNDGWLDIYVTNFYPPFEDDVTTGNAFLHNNGDGTFTNIALDNGTRFDSIGWGAVFLDADNDTDRDLYVSGSLDDTDPDGRSSAAFYEQTINNDFVTLPEASFPNDNRYSFSNAIGDIQNDGRPDIVVLNTANEPIYLWENQTENTNNWIKIQLQGTTSNRMGIGSKIKVFVGEEIYYGYTLCGEGYIAQNSQREFFGLGDATLVDAIEVHWLSGETDRIEDVAVNQTLSILEGQSPLSVEDLSLQSVRSFPNPAQNIFTLEVPSTFIGGTLVIYDMQGRLINNIGITQESILLDIAGYTSGLYMIQLENGTQKQIIRLLKR